jgi:hypothetical protein
MKPHWHNNQALEKTVGQEQFPGNNQPTQGNGAENHFEQITIDHHELALKRKHPEKPGVYIASG